MLDHTQLGLKGDEGWPQLATEAANLAGALGSSGVEDLRNRGSVQDEQTIDFIGLDEDIGYSLGAQTNTQAETQSMGLSYVDSMSSCQPTTSRAQVACPNEDVDAPWRVRVNQATAAFVLHQQQIHCPRLQARSATVVDQQAAIVAFVTELAVTYSLSPSANLRDGDRHLSPTSYPSEVEETMEELVVTERE